MSLNLPRAEAKARVIERYKRTRVIKSAAAAGDVPYGTAQRWLREAGLIAGGDDRTALGGPPRNVIKGPDPRVITRVDRDPCPKCNTRKDIGCKHFPKQPEAERPMTDRERAEAMWSKQV